MKWHHLNWNVLLFAICLTMWNPQWLSLSLSKHLGFNWFSSSAIHCSSASYLDCVSMSWKVKPVCVCGIVRLIAGLESVLATRSQVTNVFLDCEAEKNAYSFTPCLRGALLIWLPVSSKCLTAWRGVWVCVSACVCLWQWCWREGVLINLLEKIERKDGINVIVSIRAK